MQRNVIETILNTLHTEFGLMGATTLNEHVPDHTADCLRPQSHLPMTLHVSRSVFQTVLIAIYYSGARLLPDARCLTEVICN